jgi:hypothetical protein
VFGDKELRKTFGLGMDEVNEKLRISGLHNNELRDFI